jgi:polar amino acid transport system substrate-binding protein
MFGDRTGRLRPTVQLSAMLGALCLIVGACSSSGSKSGNSASSADSTASTKNSASSAPAGTATDVGAVAAIVSLVPAKFKSSGINNGQYNDYPPEEFLVAGKLAGIQPDIVQALANAMGVKVNNVSVGSFDSLIPSLVSKRFDISSSDFGVTADRLKQVDFVTEFSIGTAFATKAGSSITINGQSDLCGHSIGIEAGSYFIDQVKTVSKSCTASGKKAISVQTYPNDGARTLALTNGRTDLTATGQDALAYAATSQHVPITVQKLVLDSVPQGIIVAKNNGLGPAFEAAMHEIVKNGVYAKILAKWGLSAAAYTADQIKLLTDPSQAPTG